eukprot:GDKK01058333.1.p1 GENE.GDKK01058333.1~~GDKK01058333.1.p1  ORF type:complete len:173 (-),score=32.12 GDKK01058333.1:200-718(-)
MYQQYPQQYMAAPHQQYHHHQPQMQQQQQQPQHIMVPTYQNTSPMMMNNAVNYMWFDNNGQMRTMPVVQSMPMQAAPQHMAAMQHSSSLVPSPQQAHLQYQPTPTRTDNQLPLFPQQLAPPTVIHREGDQGFGTNSQFNMTLLGVSGMGSGIVSPNGSLDGKAVSMQRQSLM